MQYRLQVIPVRKLSKGNEARDRMENFVDLRESEGRKRGREEKREREKEIGSREWNSGRATRGRDATTGRTKRVVNYPSETKRNERKIPGGEAMGIEAAEKPLVGTPDGDPTVRFSRRTFHPHFTSLLSSFPALVTFLFAIDGVIEVEQSRSYCAVSCKFLPLALLPSYRPNSLSNILEFCHFYSLVRRRDRSLARMGNKKKKNEISLL